MQVKLNNAKVNEFAHADEVVFNTDLVGPDGNTVKLVAKLPFGQGYAWLEELRAGKPEISKKRQKSVLVD